MVEIRLLIQNYKELNMKSNLAQRTKDDNSSSLSERQINVLQCVKDAKAQGKRPYTKGVVSRMLAKGHEITEKQCAYDLGVIIRIKGTGVFSVRYGSGRTLWIYEEPKVMDGENA